MFCAKNPINNITYFVEYINYASLYLRTTYIF